jgi:NTP pyrophosphatase (non-canonical NTP hydrolase)
MKLSEYIPAAMNYLPADVLVRAAHYRNIYRLGLIAEVGEVADIAYKRAHYGRDIPAGRMLDELGDVTWFLCAWCHIAGVPVLPGLGFVDPYIHEMARDVSRLVTHGISYAPAGAPHKVTRILLYIAKLADEEGATLGDVLSLNLNKLARRFPTGHFSAAQAMARADEVPDTVRRTQLTLPGVA